MNIPTGGGLPRRLRFWEQISATTNITVSFQLEGENISAETVRQAWARCMEENPYLRCGIKPAEPPLPEQQLIFQELAHPVPQVSSESARWGPADVAPKMVAFANTRRSQAKSVAFLHLISDGSKHLLLASLNQAGMDAIASYHMFDTFLNNLACCSAGQPMQQRPQRDFVDICARIPAAKLKAPALSVPAHFMPLLMPLPSTPDTPCYTDACVKDFSDSFTKRLIEACKEHGTSVQGAISTASAIAMARVQAGQHPLPQVFLLQCPTSLRKQVEPPATAEDNACGTSWLWWIQRIKPTDGVWDIARNAWESIRSESNFKNGLTFWVRLLGHRFAHEVFSPEALDKPFTPPFTVNAGSVGKIPIAKKYGNMTVANVHSMLGTYDQVSPVEPGVMTHAHTFDERLHVTFMYNVPAVGHERGRLLAQTQIAVLEAMADSSDLPASSFLAL